MVLAVLLALLAAYFLTRFPICRQARWWPPHLA
jgi:hypothetical protein